MKNNKECDKIIKNCAGMGIEVIWLLVRDKNKEFICAKKEFLNILYHGIISKKFKLGKKNRLIPKTVQEQIAMYCNALPESSEEMSFFYKLDENESKLYREWSAVQKAYMEYFWFFTEKCPAGIAWLNEDGTEAWT